MTIKGVRKPKSKSPKQLDAEIKQALGSGNGWGPVSTPDIPPFTGASVDVDGSTIKIVPAAVRATRSPHDAWFARAVKRTGDDAWLVVSPRGHVIGCMIGGGRHWSIYRSAGDSSWSVDQERELVYRRGVDGDWRDVVSDLVRLKL